MQEFISVLGFFSILVLHPLGDLFLDPGLEVLTHLLHLLHLLRGHAYVHFSGFLLFFFITAAASATTCFAIAQLHDVLEFDAISVEVSLLTRLSLSNLVELSVEILVEILFFSATKVSHCVRYKYCGKSGRCVCFAKI